MTGPLHPLPAGIIPELPLTALAPMQDVTTLGFMHTIDRCGSPDYFVTEYFRVHVHSTLEKHIAESIVENRTGRPVFAQIIGEDVANILRTVEALLKLPIAGIDLNMGCPAPKVYKKNAGGGLLREPEKIDRLLGLMREAIPTRFTVKMRIGFEDTTHYAKILKAIDRHRIDMLSVHGRTVRQLYRGGVDYSEIRRAVESAGCPVLANGNITSATKAESVLKETTAAGVMIGRHAIRNPWIFRQCRERFSGQPCFEPKLRDVRRYVDWLWAAFYNPNIPEAALVNRLKKFLNFVGLGVDPEGQFVYRARRAQTQSELMQICDDWLIDNERAELPFADEPFPGLVSRPNKEDAEGCHL
jgi:tRNA-dihydrouridine synthase